MLMGGVVGIPSWKECQALLKRISVLLGSKISHQPVRRPQASHFAL